jgi:hypothetical protein
MTDTPSLPALPGRGRTYAFMGGVVATLLTLSVALPLALGDRPQDSGASDTVAFGDPGANAPLLPEASGAASTAPGTDLAPGEVVQPDGSVLRTDGTLVRPDGTVVPPPPGGGPAGGPAGGGPAAAPAPAPAEAPPTGARTASDQGITKDTVKLGFFLTDFGAANGLGAQVSGQNPEAQQRVADSFIAQINATVGINGRKVVPVYRNVDILDQQTMRDACTSFGQTDKVFAVAQNLGVYGDAILKCAIDQKLPYIANDGAVSSYYTQSRNYVITTQPSTLRTLLNMERELLRTGELRGKKVGVVYFDGYLLADNKRLLAQLRADGIDPVEGVLSVNEVQTALRQIPTIAQNFCQQQVEVVLLLTNSLYGRQFVQNVDRFPGCQPAYAVSDFDFAFAADGFVRGMPNSFFRRALGVTASRHGEGRVGIAQAGRDASCEQVFEKRSGLAVDRNDQATREYFDAQAVCGVTEVFRQGLARAGLNPTRASFVQAVQGLGGFDNPFYGPSSFRPGRSDSTDAVRISQAFLDCKCWRPQTGFTTAAFR